MRTKLLSAVIVIAATIWAAQGNAASAIQADHVALSISLETPVRPGTTVWAAIRQVIAPGWHTYWRNPGDSGLATSVSWVLPTGVRADAPLWPAPERFTDGAIVNYGYSHEATFLVPLIATPNAGSGMAQAKIFLLECEHMCIPENITLDLDLSKASGSPAIFVVARTSMPRPFEGRAKLTVTSKTLILTLSDPILSHASNAHFYPATLNAVDYDAASTLRLSGDTLTWTAARNSHAKNFAIFAGVLDLPGAGAFTILAKPVAATAASRVALADINLAEAIMFAFLGGLILNLMPCVLPILSMKALALGQSGGNARALRRDGAFYFMGVLATFAAMGGALLLFKSGGAALGWGFQLQSPLVMFALALLMTAIGLNLLGIFEIPLSLAGIGNHLTRGETGRGAFFTGALAVLVASPCTAPFMGTALGFALTQPAFPALAVFLALGAGFAFPFGALAFTPALVRIIPKPGGWMLRFKEFLAFPMFATAIWLIWVLSQQTGPSGLAWALSIGLGAVFLLWLLPFLPRPLRLVATIAGVAGLIALSLNIQTAPLRAASNSEWKPWSEQAVAEARAAGKPVLVDFTAAWCVTCLVNERVALDNIAVVARLKQDGVVTLRGDWTNRSLPIADELANHGRNGVPLYLLYSPGSDGRAIVLPQILTPSAVLAALDGVEKHLNIRRGSF